MIDFERLCNDYHIPCRTSGKNSQEGWIQINCPSCGDHGYHGGVNLSKKYYNCWKCGHHFLDETLSMVLGVPKKEARSIIEAYSGTGQIVKKERKIQASKVKYPIGTKTMQNKHRKYLIKRGFDPDELELIWGLKGTGPIGPYKFRIIAPIFLDGTLISYQGRDITGKAELRYKACAKENEVRDHKTSLYGIDMTDDVCVAVEGIADAWKLGPGSVSTFGTSYTKEQVLLLCKFQCVYILFDNETEAQERAENLAWEISTMGGKATVVTGIGSDPGDLSREDAKSIMQELL